MLLRVTAAALALAAGQALAQHDTTTRDRTTGQPTTTTGAQPRTTTTTGQPKLDTGGMTGRPAQMTAAMLVPSEWVIGAKVLSSGNRDTIGSVKNLVIDPSDGSVDYAIVSHGGVVGIGDKLIAVPWETFQYQSKDRVLAIGMTADQLKNAPEFKDDQWSMLGEKSWRQRTHDFFGGSRIGKADTDRDESWSENSNYQNLVKAGQRASVRGTVKDIDNKSPGGDLADGCVVTLTDQNGKDRIVHLGPSWFVKHQRTILRTGDQIEVTGNEFTFDGRDVIAARTVSGPNGSFEFRDDQGRPVWDASSGGGMTTTAQRPGDTTRTENRPLANQPNRDNNPDRANRPNEVNRDRLLATPEATPAQGYLKASTIKGQNLKTGTGDDAGEIKDFVFDASSGRMGFVVVGFGGFLGMGDERVAVPWDLFTVNNDGKLVLTDVSKDQLKSAPRITENDWSELSDPNFVTRVRQSFGGHPAREMTPRNHNDNNPPRPGGGG
jgi:sporulation protein YlmC with PRC-barrel domain